MVKKTAVLLAVVLLLVIWPAAANPSQPVYFGAVNGQLLPLEPRYMPYMAGGTLYVPTPMLTHEAKTLSMSYHEGTQTLTLWNDRKTLHFDMLFNIAFEYENGQQFPVRAIQSGNFFYVPAEFVLSYFEYDYSELSSAYGKVIRMKTRIVSNDESFLSAIDELLRRRYEEYTGTGENPTNPSPNPGETSPTPSPSPAPLREVYLTFDDGPHSAATEQILDTLDEYGMQATFFLLGEKIAENPAESGELLRRMLCQGHSLGLHSYSHLEIFYDSPQSMLTELEQTNDLLYDMTMSRSRIVRMPWGSSAHLTNEQQDMLAQEGYRFWDWNVDPEDAVNNPKARQITQRVINGLELRANKQEAAVLLLHDQSETAAALPDILQFLKNNDYTVRVINEDQRPYNYKNDIR